MSFCRKMTSFQLRIWIPEAREMHWVNGQAGLMHLPARMNLVSDAD